MKLIRTICAGALLLAGVTTAFAAPISATNDGRPVGGLTIGSTSDGAGSCPGYANCQLQSIFNVISPGTNVNTDQKNFGLYSIPGGPVEAFAPVLRIEVTANSTSQIFGMWFDNDNDGSTIADRVFAPLFNGGATAGAAALVVFDILNQDVTVNGTLYQNFGNSGFGFYLQPTGTPNPTWYSVDELNPNDETMFVAYQRSDVNRWFFGFEDVARNAFCQGPGNAGGDCDHNDIVVSIESIQGGRIPEPGSLALLGLGLAGLAAASRRKAKQA